jgi:Recombinase
VRRDEKDRMSPVPYPPTDGAMPTPTAATNLTDKARALGCKALAARANARAADLAPIVAELWAAGTKSLRGIAAALNARGIQTPRGVGEWKAGTVSQLLARL